MKPCGLPATVLACAAALLCALPAPGSSQPVLKVMTYNIQGMRPGSDPETRLYHIIENLKRIDPDIIGLQEINETLGGNGLDNQARRISEALSSHFGIPYFWHAVATHEAWWGQFTESIGIMTKHNILAMDEKSLVSTDFPRKVYYNLIDTPLGAVHFFTTHLSANEPTIGARQGAQVKAFVTEKEIGSGAIASIVTGDFNGIPTSDVVRLFVAETDDSCYIDTFAETNPTLPGYTAPAGAADARIDYVLLKRTGRLMPVTSIVECDLPYPTDAYCSDHYAVVSTFSTPRLGYPRSLMHNPTLVGRSDTVDLQLTSLSLEPVTVLSVIPQTGEFEVLPGPALPVTLTTRGASVTLRIVFSPTREGEITDTITVTTDDPHWPTARIPLGGIAVGTLTPAALGPCFTISRGPGGDLLGKLDLVTAVPSTIGSMGFAGMTGLAVCPTTGDLYAVRPDSPQSTLVLVNAQTGAAVSGGKLPIASLRTIAFGLGDTLYGGTTTGRLVRVDLRQRSVSDIMNFNGMGFGGICYDARQGKILASTYVPPFTNDSLYAIDPRNGASTLVGSTGLWIVTSSLTLDTTGALYGLTGTAANLLVRIDKSSGLGEPVNTDALENYAALAIRPKPHGTTSVDPGPTAPIRSGLLGNHPNPFNGGTRIIFRTVREDRVVLEVFNILGELVGTLVDDIRAAGTYQIDFRDPTLAGGVYVCRLRTGSLSQAGRMLYLK